MFNKIFFLALIFPLIVTSASAKEGLASQSELYTGKEYNRAFANPKDDPNVPNVLLIGDSISIGYTVSVRKLLRGKADVFRNGGNARNSSYGLEKLDRWLGDRKWDVIHFNWGLWDVCYRNPKSKAKGHRDKINGTITSTPDFYRETMSKIISRLQETSAVLIWCTTTPIPDQEVGRKVGDEIIYNKIVKDLIEGSSIITNDLHSYILPKWKNVMKKKGDVHYTDEGYQYLARKVSDVIESAIER